MREDASRALVGAKRRERRDDGECDGRHGDELEQPRENRRDEIEEVVERPDAERTEHGADDECADPEDELTFLMGLMAGEGVACRRLHRIFFFCHKDSFFRK